jgi:hypothetical protein
MEGRAHVGIYPYDDTDPRASSHIQAWRLTGKQREQWGREALSQDDLLRKYLCEDWQSRREFVYG